jgi:hypothetical protein
VDRFSVLLWTGYAINLIAPALPVAAVAIHHRSDRYAAPPWLRRLSLLQGYNLLVNWTLLGLAMNHVRNAWLAAPTYLVETLLSLWVLRGVDPRRLRWPALVPSIALILGSAAVDVSRTGFRGKWPLSETLAGLLLLLFCLLLLVRLLRSDSATPTMDQPSFWLLGAWSLILAFDLTFFPLQNLFLQRLSHAWILVPWFAKYVTGLILNLVLARTFLCPKPSSS